MTLFSLLSDSYLFVLSGQGPPMMPEFGGMPPAIGPGQPPIHLPDLSKPPPGFPPGFPGGMGHGPPGSGGPMMPHPPSEADLTPSMPYYDLPAGLMAPLVKVSRD